MARLLRIHFSSIGHEHARLAPLTVDLRARGGDGTGADTVLWLRNGGGKSSILNLFYSLFRPERREFLGSNAEARARHLEDYVKADDLAFVVTEWDVDPVHEEVLFGRTPTRRRLVGQVLSWRDRQKSQDPSRLRRRFFSLVAGRDLTFDDLPIDGLGAPVKSFEAFRDWLDDLRNRRPELEPFSDDAKQRWSEHLEKIGLDPELFRYQIKMNAREGSVDEAFRFRTTDEFIRFYLEIAFETEEADKVSAIVDKHREQLSRRPGLVEEQSFLMDARGGLGSLRLAVGELKSATGSYECERARAGSVAAAVAQRAEMQRAIGTGAQAEAETARSAAQGASNDAARLGRWANGLERLALELDVREAAGARKLASDELSVANERVAVGNAAVARDIRHSRQAERDAKAYALSLALAEQEPLRQQVLHAGATVRARLHEAAEHQDAEATRYHVALTEAETELRSCDASLKELQREEGRLERDVNAIDAWLAERDREREKLKSDGLISLREEAADALTRLQVLAEHRREEAARQAVHRDEARARAGRFLREAADLGTVVGRLDFTIQAGRKQLDTARAERDRLSNHALVRQVEHVEVADLDAVGLADRLRTDADAAGRAVLVAAVDGAEDDRASLSLERTGRLPPAPDVERALKTLTSTSLPAWSGGDYLAANVADVDQRERLVAGDPAGWHGIIVDGSALEKACALLQTAEPRSAVVVMTPRLEAAPTARDRVVLPGHPAHWDDRAGSRLRDDIQDRLRRRARERESHQARERDARRLADAVDAWRKPWGDGRLAAAESDFEQDVARRTRAADEREAALQLEKAATADELAAERARARAAMEEADTRSNVGRLAVFIERYDAPAVGRRDARAVATERLRAIADDVGSLQARRREHDDQRLASRDAAQKAAASAGLLRQERDAIDLFDGGTAGEVDLIRARHAWTALRDQWHRVVSESRLEWELAEIEKRLVQDRITERERTTGREAAVADCPIGGGEAALACAIPAQDVANRKEIEAGVVHDNAQKALKDAGSRRREADDLPADEPHPATARESRERRDRCRSDREIANERNRAEERRASEHRARAGDATHEADRCEQLGKRLSDVLDGPLPAQPAELPGSSAAIASLVEERLAGVRRAKAAVDAARSAAEAFAESLREVALSARHEAHRSRVKERLKASAADLTVAAETLQVDVEERLEVVRTTLSDIDQDRRLVLQELDKIAMDGVRMLQDAEKASRLPAGLGEWEGEPFLRIRAEVPNGQAERQSRLEPLLDRLVAKGTIPSGRELVEAAIREIAGQRIVATILKPDATLRPDRLPVTEMQTFSGAQKLTAAVLLYCGMARQRAQQRGRAWRPDGGVLLLDNPVGTSSSVPLLELQIRVARQMRVQLIYTTGVNDPNAIGTFPNTVRLRNDHRDRRTGDSHVTPEGVEAVRVVAR
jgi:hypothetical protein